MRAAQGRGLELDVGTDLTWMPVYKPWWSNSSKSSFIKPLSVLKPYKGFLVNAAVQLLKNVVCFSTQICICIWNTCHKARLLIQLFILQNTVCTKHSRPRLLHRGQKVTEDTGQVASEKEQQHGRPLEIDVTGWVSMTEWINADRIPKVKDRGILEPISMALFCSCCLRLISTMTCSETCKVRLTQRDIFGPQSVLLCSLSGQFSRCYTPSGWLTCSATEYTIDNDISANNHKITE